MNKIVHFKNRFIGHLFSFCELPGHLRFFFLKAQGDYNMQQSLRTTALYDLATD